MFKSQLHFSSFNSVYFYPFLVRRQIVFQQILHGVLHSGSCDFTPFSSNIYALAFDWNRQGIDEVGYSEYFLYA